MLPLQLTADCLSPAPRHEFMNPPHQRRRCADDPGVELEEARDEAAGEEEDEREDWGHQAVLTWAAQVRAGQQQQEQEAGAPLPPGAVPFLSFAAGGAEAEEGAEAALPKEMRRDAALWEKARVGVILVFWGMR